MITSFPNLAYGSCARKPSKVFLKIVLLAGISYTALPLSEAYADNTTKHHFASHKSGTKKAVTSASKTSTAPAQSTATTSAALPRAASAPPQIKKHDLLQSPSSAPEIVTVTGTRLSQTRLTNVMAGVTVDAAQLRARGYTDMGLALMRENTAFTVGDNSPIGSQGSFGAGQSMVSLLGLGSQRTLTLIDGMRMVGGSTASNYGAGSGSQVDVSTIPTSLIKKVDTRLGGAGAAYGADAVAGVVNYQLDDHFTGVDFNAQGNWTQKLDAPQEKITFKAGTEFDHGKGGLVFDVEYRNAGGMVANDRPYITGNQATTYARPAYGSTTPYARVLTPGVRFLQNSVTGLPTTSADYGQLPVRAGKAGYAFSNAAGQPLMFSQNGQSLVPITYNSALKDGLRASGGNGIALQDYNQLYAPSDKLNLTMLGHYDFTNHLHATWQGWYARGSASSLVGQGTWNTPQFDDPLSLASYQTNTVVNGAYQLSTNNPYLTPAVRAQIINGLQAAGQPTDTFYLSRLNQDLDAGMYRTDLQMFRFQGGLNGDFDTVGRHFEWSVKGEYSKYMNDTWEPSIVTQNLVNALNSTTDASGNIVCSPGYTSSTAATRSSSCSPLNPFGYNQMTPAARDYVIADAHSKNTNAQRDLQAEIHSTVAHLPAGDIRWDLGYEHRREGYNFNPGSFFRGEQQADGTYKQYGNSTAIPPTTGAYHTHEVFGELDIPLVSPNMHVPGVYSLSATANGRFINNSMTGNYWTYMFGGAWWPTQDFGLSGNYAQSVRNPSVTELFAPQSTTYNTAQDPCSIEYINSGPNPALRSANCRKEGIPAGGFNSNINYYTAQGKSGGNKSLQNETSHSYTGTLDFHPHFIRGFDLTASFVDVKVNNEITSLDVGDLMNACYDSASYPNNAYCNSFKRDSDHQIESFTSGYFNIANQHMQVLQANIDYFLPLYRFGLPQSAGNLELRGNYSHYLRNQQTYLGSTYILNGSTSAPNDLFTLDFNYTRGPLFFQWQTIYYGKSKYQLQVSDYTYEHNNRPGFAYFNTTFGYQITKNIDANFMINNITGALPKYPGTVSLTRYYDAIMGRSFQLNVGVHF
ncbi:TonB-dependent receptor [Gluconobacter japonicus]|uniref:TonB-dependent receptor n=1 Tax=Gluconobacter japonicus TaxID=376620 RepID=UPI000783609D|nr:TonB-dependent receptor [Gluconobacter japonicus]KXV22285.1 TonB-dependent receptor [Gluconobacter japonicus]